MPKTRKELISLEAPPTTTAFHAVYGELFYAVMIQKAEVLKTKEAKFRINDSAP